jgi:hypothetical protein
MLRRGASASSSVTSTGRSGSSRHSPTRQRRCSRTTQFNDPPAAGNQFFIATVAVTYVPGTCSWNPGIRIVSDLNTVGPSNVAAEAGSLIAFYDFADNPFWMALR